ncbi:MAG: FemAB family XrtA/PEP-CTERM system-associated protein [Planctomycetota bacterium]|jgi:FemAB-related protein (PEP-CTERM system-associated)
MTTETFTCIRPTAPPDPARSADLSVVPCDASRRRDWEDFVQHSPRTTLAHHPGWTSVVQDTFGHEPLSIMAYRAGRAVGVLPLVLVKSLVFGRFLVSSPYLTSGGIAADDEPAAEALAHEAARLGHELRVDYVEVRNDQPCPGFAHAKPDYCTLALDLDPGQDRIWDGLHESARRNVRKARRGGLDVVEGHENLGAFVEINARNMHRLGTPAHGPRFFGAIVKHVPDSHLVMARAQDGTFVGGMLLVRFNETVFMPWVGSRPEHLDLRPNNLLYWQAVVFSCRHGARRLDFGRSKWGSGTFRFKAQHGARPVPLAYQFHLIRSRAVPRVDPDNPRLRPLVSLWRRLPRVAVNLIGPHLIKSIP